MIKQIKFRGHVTTYSIKNKGPKIDPCGTSHTIFFRSESYEFNETYSFLLLR